MSKNATLNWFFRLTGCPEGEGGWGHQIWTMADQGGKEGGVKIYPFVLCERPLRWKRKAHKGSNYSRAGNRTRDLVKTVLPAEHTTPLS